MVPVHVGTTGTSEILNSLKVESVRVGNAKVTRETGK